MKPTLTKLWAAFPDHVKYPTLSDFCTWLGGAAAKTIESHGFGPSGAAYASRLSVTINKGGAAFLLALAAAGGLSTPAGAARREATSRRDLEGYATAVCLIDAGDAYLKDQGYRWSSILVQERGVPQTELAALDAAVKARVAQGGMVVVRDEASPTGDRTLPLVFCARIVDAPGVLRELERLATRAGR